MKKTIILNLVLLFAAAQTAYCQYGGGTGTPNDPYLIYDANQMNDIGASRSHWNKHFKLMADIDLSAFTGTSFNIIGIPWDEPFTGTFDGNNHTISNFTYSSPGQDYVGLFGIVNEQNAQIKNVGLLEPNVHGGEFSGSLVGWFRNGTMSSCWVQGGTVSVDDRQVGGLVGANGGTISNCYSTCSVTGHNEVGVLVGRNGGTIIHSNAAGSVAPISPYSIMFGGLVGCNTGVITDCNVNSNVSVAGRSFVGGLTALNLGTLTRCYSIGSVLGGDQLGGLAGENEGTISGCYSSSSVTATGSSAGGLVGVNWDNSSIINCYASGAVSSPVGAGGLLSTNNGTVSNCYSTGSVSGTTSYIGGLLGYNVGFVINCFWNKETSGQNTSADGTGLTTAEMMTESIFTSAAWDFNTPVWQICDELCYPKLAWQQGLFMALTTELDFPALLDGPNPPSQSLSIGNCLSGSLHWTISEDCDWLSLDVNSGTSGPFDSNDVILTADINGLDYGFYSCDLTVTDPNAQNNPQTFPVTLHVCIYRLGEIFVPDEYSTIQHAIDAAGPNNTVMVDPGTHYDNINFSAKNITVSSIDPNDATIVANTVIDGNNQGPVVTFRNGEDANCVLAGFTITDGNDQGQGAGISCTGDYTSPTIRNCIVIANQGTGIHCDQTTPTIKNCIIAGNTDAGLVTRGRKSANIANCTIVENAGCGLDSNWGKPQITNSIIWANADSQIYGAPTITYSDLQGGWPGQGNIDVDPCFVLAGLWVDTNDPNIVLEPNDANAIWLEGDYHLLRDSPCIDVGDPNYTPEPNETDLDGNPRVIDGDQDGFAVIDMGAYELAYTPVEAQMKLKPHTLNCTGRAKSIKAHITLPDAISPEDVDVNTPAVAEPPGVESEYIKIVGGDSGPVKLEIAFDRRAFCEALSETGEIEVTVTGSLTTGQYFYATNTIRIKPNCRQIIWKSLNKELNKPQSGKSL
ncbi:MAG: right-handed parallel beta-helix repeat-containing protein [Planctomycetota bacterium]|nr:MAG: right-handed parallel beta-helix repeat-containing protein [Planctomycetota bacterium]